jgi:hypothetical protein
MSFARPISIDPCRLRRGAAYWPVALLILAAVGCGDGTVDATGRVTIEGQPAAGGRLTLSPIGGGSRAFCLVTEEGEFALRARSDASGAVPGSYRITFRQPLDADSRARLASELAGQFAVDNMTVMYFGPSDQPLVIPEAGSQDLAIDIRQEHGWTRSVSE